MDNPQTLTLVPSADLLDLPLPSLPADKNPRNIYLKTLAESGRRSMVRALERAARILTCGQVGAEELPWWELRKHHLAALRAELVEPTGPFSAREDGQALAPKTVNLILAAVKGVLREAVDLGMLPHDAYAAARRVKSLRDTRPLAGRMLADSELHLLRSACRDTLAGKRDCAILAVLFAGGLRRTESVWLTLEDWDSSEGRLLVRKGKGSKQRHVILRAGARAAVDEWIEARGPQPGPLFVSIRHGRVGDRRLSAQAIYDSLQRLARRADVAKFSPHDLRRSCASLMLEAGADVFAVQRQLGHESPVTTSRYDRRSERAQEDAADRLMRRFAF
jgi:site-specific recombinase XerD